jgi:uncharacterized phage protein (TIGR02220 family)
VSRPRGRSITPEGPQAPKARYGKISTRMWGDEWFRSLSAAPPNGQTLWIHLLTGPHTLHAIPGLFMIGEAAMAEALGWPLEGFREAFREVSAKGKAKADWKARVIWVPKALVYNAPESPNVVKSWSKFFIELPECELKDEAFHSLTVFVEGLGEGFREAFREAFRDPLGYPSRNHEHEHEHEHEEEPLSGNGARQDTSKPGSTEAHQGSEAHEAEAPAAPARAGHLKVVPDNTAAREILDHLNRRTGHAYEPLEANLKLIRARLAEPGRTRQQVLAVIDAKVAQWLNDPEMKVYLRPSTLFRATSFAQYVGALTQGKAEPMPETPEEAYVRKQLTLMGEVVTLEQARVALAKRAKTEGTHVG